MARVEARIAGRPPVSEKDERMSNRFDPSLRSLALALALCTVLVACGDDDDPTGPGGGQAGELDVPVSSLAYGTVFRNSVTERSFEISVAADAAGPVSGEVALSSGTSGRYEITQGDGPFTLAPGESRLVAVLYSAGSPGFEALGSIEFGVGDRDVSLSGFSSEPPKYRITPTGLNQVGVNTNYQPFVGEVPLSGGSGRSFGAGESWIGCASSNGWIFDGQGISESTVGLDFVTPPGATSVIVEMGIEAEDGCTQALIQIDGDETTFTDLSGCEEVTASLPAEDARTDVDIGTDQQGFCGGDLHVRWVEVEFQGLLVSKSNWLD